MPTPKLWSNVSIAMQSALAAAKTITAITKANPGVVSSTAHGYANGDYVLLTVQGMNQVNGRVFRVAAAAADTFQLEGEDTTSYDTFTSGTAQKITFGTTLGTVKGLNATGGEYDFKDTTTIHDAVGKQMPGIASAVTYSFDHIWDPADTALIAMRQASDIKAQRAFLFTFPGGAKMVLNGYVGAALIPGGGAQDVVTTSSVITATGLPTYYAS